MLLFLLSLVASLASAQHFFDYGYSYPGYGYGSGFGFGFFSNLCNQYAEWFEFFVLFVVFFVAAHWAFKGRSKSDVLAAVIGFALAIGIVRWESFTGFSLVCGFGDLFSGLFGGFLGIFVLLLIILIFFAFARGGDGAKTMVGLAYILFYFWLGTGGGIAFTSFFYYLPLDPFFVEAVLNILLLVAFVFVVIFGWRWFKAGRV